MSRVNLLKLCNELRVSLSHSLVLHRSIKIHVLFCAYVSVRARICYDMAYMVLFVNCLNRFLLIRVNAMKMVSIFIRILHKCNRQNVVLV